MRLTKGNRSGQTAIMFTLAAFPLFGMLGLGIVFQIPTLALLLGRIGLVTPRLMLKVWRHAIVIIAILAAVLTPTPDAFNMMVFMLPMLGLYFLSVGIVWLVGKPRKSDAEVRALAHSE